MENTKYFVDVINLNADASCLYSDWWLKMLSGGKESYFCKYLSNYIHLRKKATLGIMGATLCDIAVQNPEAIELINQNRDIFEILLRPFSHDIAILRSTEGFTLNLELGKKILEKAFGHYTPYYLPPEFMLTNEQVAILEAQGIKGTFILPKRFNEETQNRISKQPYVLNGLFDSKLNCIPFSKTSTNHYLYALHFFDAAIWNKNILDSEEDYVFSWRDGESPFFIPNGLEREKVWLEQENSTAIQRVFLSEVQESLEYVVTLPQYKINHYPLHSFSPWAKEQRTLNFLGEIKSIENRLSELSNIEIVVWLQAINSDIMSAVEKLSPTIPLKNSQESTQLLHYTIWRSNRGVEGEEYLAILKQFKEAKISRYIAESTKPHIIKLRHRIAYLAGILT